MGANVYQKIVTIKEVKSIVEGLKQSGKTCVHVHGCFDLLHYGHLKFFEKAKEYGDTLIVSLTPDKYIFKGPGRPMFDQHQRTNYIANIEIVDYVVLNDQEDCVDFLLEVSPNISARGIEYKELDNDVTGKISIEKSALESVGGKMIFIDEIVFSSTKIINIYQEHLTEEQHRYRDYLNKHIQLEDIDKVMLLIQQLNVLIVGETIFDEYIYCSVLGTVSKHSAISSSFHHRQFMQGGGLAVAKHLASLADSVKFITINGKKNDEDLIFDVKDTASLGVIAVSDPDNYTTLKRRYIASGYPSPMSGELVEDFVDTNNRLFEINYLPDNILSDSVKQELLTQMQNQITQSDIVLVTDFGHGMFDDEIINKIEEQNKFIAINVQTNSSNFGFNLITKFTRADFICIDELEARLALSDNSSHINDIAKKIFKIIDCKSLMITRGKKGITLFSSDTIRYAPALAVDVVDAVGAGDAVFSIAATAAYVTKNEALIVFLSSIMGMLATGIVGNSKSIEKHQIMKSSKGFI